MNSWRELREALSPSEFALLESDEKHGTNETALQFLAVDFACEHLDALIARE